MASDKQHEGPSKAQYAMPDCPQCLSLDKAALTKSSKSEKLPASHTGRVIYLDKYLADRVQSLLFQIEETDRTTSILMNKLILEKDHAIARRLQREIGRLDAKHVSLYDQLREEKRRHQRHAERRSRQQSSG